MRVSIHRLFVSCALVGLLVSSENVRGQQAPTATANVTAAPAAFVPLARKFSIEEKQPLHFKFPTNAGLIEGTIDVLRLEAMGVEGWGRFDLRITLDPNSVQTGDPLMDKHIARYILQGDDGPIVVGASERLPPKARPGLGEKPEDELFGAVLWLDRRRAGKRVELRFKWEGNKEEGTLFFAHQATVKEMGLSRGVHPFVEVTGPLELRFQAPLSRRR